MNQFTEFLKKNLGFIIGLVIGIILVICGLAYFVLNLAVMIGFGFIGRYIQNNKDKVKVTLKAWIDKM